MGFGLQKYIIPATIYRDYRDLICNALWEWVDPARSGPELDWLTRHTWPKLEIHFNNFEETARFLFLQDFFCDFWSEQPIDGSPF